MNKLTKEQAIIITGYTGITACDFSTFHEDVEKRLGHPIWTHEFASKELREKLREIYREDFIKICYVGSE
jgi:hypothetical protein